MISSRIRERHQAAEDQACSVVAIHAARDAFSPRQSRLVRSCEANQLCRGLTTLSDRQLPSPSLLKRRSPQVHIARRGQLCTTKQASSTEEARLENRCGPWRGDLRAENIGQEGTNKLDRSVSGQLPHRAPKRRHHVPQRRLQLKLTPVNLRLRTAAVASSPLGSNALAQCERTCRVCLRFAYRKSLSFQRHATLPAVVLKYLSQRLTRPSRIR